ncbi:hypothetical protein H0H93_010025 [Arthromyces matolae]|nr:hypothetical protein H0H93_010025 [Arthromyces matolae]
MRIAFTLILSALVASVLPFVTALRHPHAGPLVAKHAAHKKSQVIAQRQHHVHRDLIDLCLNVDASVLAPILHLIDPLAAKIHLCLCLKDLDIFLDTDIGVLLGKLLGGNDLLAKIKLLINTSPQSQQCTFPPHSHRLCVASKPCAYECDPPYVKQGDKCVCPPPMIECNGVCGNFDHGCSSAVPHKFARKIDHITTYADAAGICGPNHMVCGIPGREDTNDFECIDTKSTLDSCGGCAVRHPFKDGPPLIKGSDCGRLPGVISSTCSNSGCEVTQCRTGWHLDVKRNECVHISAGPTRRSMRSRMIKSRNDVDVKTVIPLDLARLLDAYVLLVVKLSKASRAASSPSSLSTFDHIHYINSILAATIYTLKSPTVAALAANIDALVSINELALNAANGCDCIRTLDLRAVYDDLVAVVNAARTLQDWCHSHQVDVSAKQTDASRVSDTSGAGVPVTVGLDDILNNLLNGLGISTHDTHIDVFGLGPGLTDTTNKLLGSLGIGPGNVKLGARGSATTSSPELLKQQTKAFVDTSSLPSTSDAPVTVGLDALANDLLNGLGISTHDTHADVFGLGPGLTDTTNKLLGGLGIGPGNVQSRALGSATSTTSNPELLKQTKAFVDTSSLPETSDRPITAGLDDLANGLLSGLGISTHNTHADVYGLGSGLTDATNELLGGLGIGPGNVHSRALGSPTFTTALNPELLKMTRTLVDSVVALKDKKPNLPPPQSSRFAASGSPPVDYNLINAILQAVVNLLKSTTVSSFAQNADTLVDVNKIVASLLRSCDCLDVLGLSGLLEYLDAVLNAALGIQNWCSHNPIGVPLPASSGVPVPRPTTTASPATPPLNPASSANLLDTTIILDLDLNALLENLGLGPSSGGGLPDLNSLLGGLLGNIKTPANNTNGAPLNTGNLVDPALLSQIEQLLKLTVALLSESGVLPSSSSSPATGTLPIDGNLIAGIVQAVLDLLNSGTVGDLLRNLHLVAGSSTGVSDAIGGCKCSEQLGLGGLVKAVDSLLAATLNTLTWCSGNPVIPGAPPNPHSSLPTTTTSVHSPVPTTIAVGPNSNLLDLVINLNVDGTLDGLVNALTLGLLKNPDTSLDLRNLLSTLVNVVVQLVNDSVTLPLASTTNAPLPTSIPTNPASCQPLTQGLVDDILLVVDALLGTNTTTELLTKVNELLGLSIILGESIDCVGGLDLQDLEKDLDVLVDVLLDIQLWCKHRKVAKAGSDTIKIDTHDLLSALGLDKLLSVKGEISGLGLGSTVNPLLHEVLLIVVYLVKPNGIRLKLKKLVSPHGVTLKPEGIDNI